VYESGQFKGKGKLSKRGNKQSAKSYLAYGT